MKKYNKLVLPYIQWTERQFTRANLCTFLYDILFFQFSSDRKTSSHMLISGPLYMCWSVDPSPQAVDQRTSAHVLISGSLQTHWSVDLSTQGWSVNLSTCIDLRTSLQAFICRLLHMWVISRPLQMHWSVNLSTCGWDVDLSTCVDQ